MERSLAQTDANRMYLHTDGASLSEAATTINLLMQVNQAADHLISRLVYTDPLYFVWMYNRLLVQVIVAN